MKNYGRESETVEFKKNTSELKEGCISMTAMLNKHGVGTVYFGVKNNGDAAGQDVSETTLRDVSSAIARYTFLYLLSLLNIIFYPQLITC